jgi:hypothetical protein
MSKFARLWPDTLSAAEARDDLGYSAEVGLSQMVSTVLTSHGERNTSTEAMFHDIDLDGDGKLDRYELERFVRKHMVRGREKYGWMARRQDVIHDLVDKARGPAPRRERACATRAPRAEHSPRAQALHDMDLDKNGKVDLREFQIWSLRNTMSTMVDGYLAERTMAENMTRAVTARPASRTAARPTRPRLARPATTRPDLPSRQLPRGTQCEHVRPCSALHAPRRTARR